MKAETITLHTIGFTKKSARQFFDTLRNSGTKKVIDVRLNNISQLAGFSKKEDLKYFLKQILNIDYAHLPLLAPTQDILDAYKKHKVEWRQYEREFRDLMRKREIERQLDPSEVDEGCLLCSEDKPHHCHRRLVAEYLREQWGNVVIDHI